VESTLNKSVNWKVVIPKSYTDDLVKLATLYKQKPNAELEFMIRQILIA